MLEQTQASISDEDGIPASSRDAGPAGLATGLSCSDNEAIAAQMTQPLTAILMNAEAALRWLSAHQADLDEVRRAVERIIADGRQAADAVRQVRYAASAGAEPERGSRPTSS